MSSNAGSFFVPAAGALTAFPLVGDVSSAFSRTAENDSSLSFAFRYSDRGRMNEERIIHRFFGIRAEIHYFVAFFGEKRLDRFFVLEASVVRAYRDAHGPMLLEHPHRSPSPQFRGEIAMHASRKESHETSTISSGPGTATGVR